MFALPSLPVSLISSPTVASCFLLVPKTGLVLSCLRTLTYDILSLPEGPPHVSSSTYLHLSQFKHWLLTGYFQDPPKGSHTLVGSASIALLFHSTCHSYDVTFLQLYKSVMILLISSSSHSL